MTPHLSPYRMALRSIALLVPEEERQEWLAEWTSELWYVAQAEATPLRRHLTIAQFCRGAIVDARHLRQPSPRPVVKPSGSAIVCAGALVCMALAAFTLAQAFPAARRALLPSAFRQRGDVFAIWPTSGSSEVPLSTMRAWTARRQHLFTEFAFYEPITRPLHLAPGSAPSLRIARASANALAIMGLPAVPQAPVSASEPTLMLSESAWKQYFQASPEIFGRTLKVGLQTVRVGGILPDDVSSSSLAFDAWLLLPSAYAAALPAETPVTLLARLAPQEPGSNMKERWRMAVPSADGPIDYDCVAINPSRTQPWRLFVFAALLALLALPATTSLSLGEYPTRHASLPRIAVLRRWLFLGVKLALALPAIDCAATALAYAPRWHNASTSAYLQLIVTFAATLFALRWALRDQRQRCPVCLGRLTCPARVGEPSRNFLSWNGTELICAGGHGFLHVPELPTSWFSAPRWLHLDPTWRGLFPGPA